MQRRFAGTIARLAMALSLAAAAAWSPAALPATAAAPASAPASPHALPVAPGASASLMSRHRPKVIEHYVDINSAPRKELMTLPGVDAALADKIIAKRPYLTKTQLVTKGVMETGPYLSLKDRVVAMQKFKRPASAPKHP